MHTKRKDEQKRMFKKKLIKIVVYLSVYFCIHLRFAPFMVHNLIHNEW